MSPRMYTLKEASGILNIAYSTLRDQVLAGRAAHLHPLIVGPKIVFPIKVIDAVSEGKAA